MPNCAVTGSAEVENLSPPGLKTIQPSNAICILNTIPKNKYYNNVLVPVGIKMRLHSLQKTIQQQLSAEACVILPALISLKLARRMLKTDVAAGDAQ